MKIKRKILPKLQKELTSDKILLLTGPRQIGKTTLLQLLQQGLDPDKTVNLNLDIEDDFELLSSQSNFLRYLKLRLGTQNRSYVFIDEIQRKKDAGLFLKGLYDSDLPYKFVLSGSGSLELKERVSEGLAGRKIAYQVDPISFEEFVNYKTDYKYEQNLEEYFELKSSENSLLEEYLQFGGYPEVITSETLNDKRAILTSIYDSFIDKDLKELLDVRDTSSIGDILAFLSSRIGSLTNTRSLSNIANLSYPTLKKYIYYLRKTFIIQRARPYFTNPETELTKTPMYYFKDLGMRNFVFNKLSHYDPIISGGMLFQNFIFNEIRSKENVFKVNYWRTKDQAEVDLVVNLGSENIPVEVKYKRLDNDKLSRSMHSFINKYKPSRAFLVNLDFSGHRKVEETDVHFVPHYKLIGNFLDLVTE